MSEQQSIRDQLISVAINACESGDAVWVRDAEAIADALLASPVIRRIQAEALRDAARDLYHEMRRGMVDPVKYIELGAVRIETKRDDD